MGVRHQVHLKEFDTSVGVGVQGLHIRFPGPELAQGSNQETAEQGEGPTAVGSEYPAEPLAEAQQSCQGTATERSDAHDIEGLECANHGGIGTQQNQDEGPADARQDHGTNGDGSSAEEEDRMVALHQRG